MLSRRRKCRIDRSPRPRSLRGTESDLVTTVRIQQRAAHRLDEIYRYSRDRWGDDQAEKNISGLFAAFDKIATHGVASRPIPAEFGIESIFFRYEHHCVYWCHLSSGDIGIVTILHERMHQIDRFRDDFGIGR